MKEKPTDSGGSCRAGSEERYMAYFKSGKHGDSPKQAIAGKITFPFSFFSYFFLDIVLFCNFLDCSEPIFQHLSFPFQKVQVIPVAQAIQSLISLLLRVLQNLLVTENEAGWRSLVLESS